MVICSSGGVLFSAKELKCYFSQNMQVHKVSFSVDLCFFCKCFVLPAGIVGCLVLPILGTVPDALIILASGIGPNAQQQLNVGVGALAGSTIMLLTLPWALSILYGRVNLDPVSPQAGGGSSSERTPRYRGQPKLSPDRAQPLRTTGVAVSPSIHLNAWYGEE
jgi:hypothetical protein